MMMAISCAKFSQSLRMPASRENWPHRILRLAEGSTFEVAWMKRVMTTLAVANMAENLLSNRRVMVRQINRWGSKAVGVGLTEIRMSIKGMVTAVGRCDKVTLR